MARKRKQKSRKPGSAETQQSKQNEFGPNPDGLLGFSAKVWSLIDEISAGEFAASEMFMSSHPAAMIGWIKFPPWRYYIYNNLPARIWNIEAMVSERKFKIKFVYIKPAEGTYMIRPNICDPGDISMVQAWTPKQKEMINQCIHPRNFIDPDGWQEFLPPISDCGCIHTLSPINFDMNEDEIWVHSLYMIRSILGCCNRNIPKDLVEQFLAMTQRDTNKLSDVNMVKEILMWIDLDMIEKARMPPV